MAEDEIAQAARAWAWGTYRMSGDKVCSAAAAGYEAGYTAGLERAAQMCSRSGDGHLADAGSNSIHASHRDATLMHTMAGMIRSLLPKEGQKT